MKNAQQPGIAAIPRTRRYSFVLLVLLPVLLALRTQAAQGLGGIQRGFKAAEFFEPPHETQMQSMLQADQVQPLSEKRFLLTGVRLQTYRLPARPGANSEPELLIRAPQCLYNLEGKTASSAGLLRVTTADGKFSIEGEGFSMFQTNSSLVISNRVLTRVDPDLLNPQPGRNAQTAARSARSGIEIRADHFDYSGENGLGQYERNVRVSGSNDLSLTSEKLVFELPFKERRLNTLKAEGNVVIDRSGVHATSQTALYSAATGLVRLLGDPAWRDGLRQGRGDELIIDRTNEVFRAEGNTWVKMPAQGLSISSLLTPSNEVAAASTRATNQFVEVSSDYHQFTTNRALFGDHVAVIERVADRPEGTMTCGFMEVSYTGSNQLQSLVAQTNVVIRDATNVLHGGRAVFTGTNGVLLMTENPAWSSGLRSGRGALIRVDTRAHEMLVQGSASMRLPARELSRAAGARAPRAETPPRTAESNEWAEVTSEEYTLKPGGAEFRGSVRATHPGMKYACGLLDVRFPEAGGQVESIVADRHVSFELVDEKGQEIHGRGDKAVYTYSVTGTTTNDLVRLTGEPAVLETAHGTNRNNLIIFDRAKQQIITPGQYRITAPPFKGAGTNAFELPNTKLRK